MPRKHLKKNIKSKRNKRRGTKKIKLANIVVDKVILCLF